MTNEDWGAHLANKVEDMRDALERAKDQIENRFYPACDWTEEDRQRLTYALYSLKEMVQDTQLVYRERCKKQAQGLSL